MVTTSWLAHVHNFQMRDYNGFTIRQDVLSNDIFLNSPGQFWLTFDLDYLEVAY